SAAICFSVILRLLRNPRTRRPKGVIAHFLYLFPVSSPPAQQDVKRAAAPMFRLRMADVNDEMGEIGGGEPLRHRLADAAASPRAHKGRIDGFLARGAFACHAQHAAHAAAMRG